MKPQKAKHLYLEDEKKNPAYTGHDYSVFEKYDGWYGYWDMGSNIMSRQMREIPSLAWLSDELNVRTKALPRGRLIFEILVEGSPEFKDLNGILNRHEPARNAYLKVHDFIPTGEASMMFEKRFYAADKFVSKLNHPCVTLARRIGVSHFKTFWQKAAEQVWAEGGEGVIMKKNKASYSEGKRNADLMKIKMEHSEEMLVQGTVQGEGKYTGTLGALLVLDHYKIEHKVSGMTDYERDTWWKDPDAIIGKVVEVDYMKRLANGSLREPRFKAVRHDKTPEELG